MNDADQDDQYAYWYAVLRGEKVPMVETEPQLGFYRCRSHRDAPWLPVAIFDAERGDQITRVALVDGKPADLIKTWLQCADKAVAHANYEARIQRGKWPGDYTPLAVNDDGDPLGNFTGNYADLLSAELDNAAEWLASIKTITEESDAHKAANIASVIRKLKTKAEKLHKEEKAPHLEACRAVDEKFLPRIKRADAGIKKLLAAIDNWRKSQEVKSSDEEATPPVRLGGQHGRVISQHTVTEYVVVDHAKALAYFAEHGVIKQAVAELATKLGKAGTVAPGVEKQTRLQSK
jgi:hypothetical protein